jgi:hypothetical protein
MSDCGGSLGVLSHLSGQPVIGQSMQLGMDAGQAPGVVGFLAFAVHPAPGWPPCGLGLPGVGELMLDPAPPTPVALFGGATAWSGTAPLVFNFAIPYDPTLLTADVYVQGLWADFAGVAPPEPLRLTTGIALKIGG